MGKPLKKLAGRALNGLRQLVFPDYCAACERPADGDIHQGICSQCWGDIAEVGDNVCAQCGDLLPSPETTAAWQDFKCGACRQRHRVPYEQCRSVFWYSDPLDTIVKLFKFHGFQGLSTPLAAHMARFAAGKQFFASVDLVVPVPISLVRRLRRGYNQSELLARRLAALLQVPLAAGSLVRKRHSRPQSVVVTEERRKNVRGAFATRNLPAAEHALLIDDIYTTGATVEECARVLRREGAERVSILTLSRAKQV